jgi:hypothetical protein
MPYLDMQDHEHFVHLVQPFLAAHPEDRAVNEEIRTQEDRPSEYFLSADGIRRMALWARERHLLRRKDAARLREVAAYVFAHPRDVVTLTPRVLGTPPRLQLTVLATEIYGWLYAGAPEHDTEVIAFTLEAASVRSSCTRGYWNSPRRNEKDPN